jgi:hypothetical protein
LAEMNTRTTGSISRKFNPFQPAHRQHKGTDRFGLCLIFHPAWWLALLVLISACQPAPPKRIETLPVEAPPPLVTPTPTLEPPLAPNALPVPTLEPTAAGSPEPPGCQEPPQDYTLVRVNGVLLNRRTLAMLQHAAELYGGEIDLAGAAITQGSYTNGEPASFGTHSGGGAVDLSVMRRGTFTVLYGDIEPVIHTLRTAGFAAWLRDLDEMYDGSPIHIHAVAIGDQQLSKAALDQISGAAGYFHGYNGLVLKNGLPGADRHEGPVICRWMVKFMDCTSCLE